MSMSNGEGDIDAERQLKLENTTVFHPTISNSLAKMVLVRSYGLT